MPATSSRALAGKAQERDKRPERIAERGRAQDQRQLEIAGVRSREPPELAP